MPRGSANAPSAAKASVTTTPTAITWSASSPASQPVKKYTGTSGPIRRAWNQLEAATARMKIDPAR